MQPLLHIGYHKTGTTLLQKRVFSKKHNGFRLVAGAKEIQPAFVGINPFDFDPHAARAIFQPDIEAQGFVSVISYERLSGNPHQFQQDSREIADRLAATFPEARVLIVIREQVSMILSLYKTYVRMGGPASLEEYIPTSSRRLLFRFDYLEYHRLIAYYQRLFEEVLVLPYELLVESPEQFLARLGEFSGAPATNAVLGGVNISPSPLVLCGKRYANKLITRTRHNPSPILPFEVSSSTVKRLASRIDQQVPDSLRSIGEKRWRDFVNRQVEGRYEKSNMITQGLTGLDLQSFGYASGR